MKKAHLYILLAIAAAFLSTCMVANAYLAYAIPLSEQDLNHTSWLIPYSIATHFSSSKLGLIVASLAVAISLSMFAAHANRIGFFITILLFVNIKHFASYEHLTRLAYINEGAKIGCYVEEIYECKRMLGLNTDEAQSMYGNNGLADWYTEERGSFDGQHIINSFPGVMFLKLPLTLTTTSVEELKSTLTQQRLRVAELKTTN